MKSEITYQSEEEMKVGIPLGCEHDHIDNLFQMSRQTPLQHRQNQTLTQKMAPTAAVSMAVLISLSMIVSVSKETGRRDVRKSRYGNVVKGSARTAEAGLASAQVEEQSHAKGGYDGGIRTCGFSF